MTNQWAIAVGINHYQYFQSLHSAQRDAQLLSNGLVQYADFSPDRCIVLSDTSAPVWDRSTHPNRLNLLSWVDYLVHQGLQPGDLLWWFFSGYGVCFQGQDYLVPIDGNPIALTSTAIPMQALFASLQQLPTQTLVLLDISRIEGSLSKEAVGNQTAELAAKTGIATVLSCRPGEYSREDSGLGCGFFTAALLEGLREGRTTTLVGLERFLSDRVPQLAEQYFRPTQQPLVISPPEKLDQIILPHGKSVIWQSADSATSSRELLSLTPEEGLQSPQTVTQQTSASPQPMQAGGSSSSWQSTNGAANGTANGAATVNAEIGQGAIAQTVINGASTTPSPVPPTVLLPNSASPSLAKGGEQPNERSPFGPQRPQNSVIGNAMGTQSTNSSSPLPSDPAESTINEISDTVFWQRLLIVGGAIVIALLAGVLKQNWTVFTMEVQPTSVASPLPTTSGGKNSPAATETAKLPTDLSQLNLSKSQPNAGSSLSANSSNAVSQPFNTQPFTAGTKPTNSPTSASIPQSPAPQSAAQNQANQAILEAARASINQPNQASLFYRAIVKARQIQPGQPLYDQAQQDIARWSQTILDMARSRAKAGNLESAIAAAKFVPQDKPAIYKSAQDEIAQWQSQQIVQRTNEKLLKEAMDMISPRQASSYNRAIDRVSRIKPGQPKYTEAQQFVSQWSQTIFDLAKYRASRGQITNAIETAMLIPNGTSAYPSAQKALMDWKRQQGVR